MAPGGLPDIDLPGGGVRVLSSIAPPCSLQTGRRERLSSVQLPGRASWESCISFPHPQALIPLLWVAGETTASSQALYPVSRDHPSWTRHQLSIAHSSNATKTFTWEAQSTCSHFHLLSPSCSPALSQVLHTRRCTHKSGTARVKDGGRPDNWGLPREEELQKRGAGAYMRAARHGENRAWD